tara:strand:- start:52 stop:276 length:225 start_codon:yes stop_codon:yes gene_type:complete
LKRLIVAFVVVKFFVLRVAPVGTFAFAWLVDALTGVPFYFRAGLVFHYAILSKKIARRQHKNAGMVLASGTTKA